MVKILFDPIVTNDPRYCSMNFKMQNAMRWLLENRDDVYCRYLIPDDNDDEANWVVDRDWLLNHPRVEYIPISVRRDRMQEYYRLSDQLSKIVRFNGEYYDTDIMVTARISMVPQLKTLMSSVRAVRPLSRKIVTVEDMPVMSFKRCVAQQQPDVQDLQHVTGYLAADRNLFFSFWEKDAMLREARKWLAPSKVRELSEKSFDSSPIQIEGTRLKRPEDVQRTVRRESPFTIAYTQRFEIQHRRSDDVMKLFEKQWIFRGGRDKTRFVVTSNSKSATGSKDTFTEFIEFYRPPREEFWRMMREEVDVVIVMSIDDAYPLSLIEPLLEGTPCVVLDVPYARATLGEDYPFFAANSQAVYAMTKAFFDDYEGMYAKFAAWSKDHYEPLMLKRNETWFPYLLNEVVDQHIVDMREQLAASARINSVVDLLVEKAPDEFVMMEEIGRLKATGDVKELANQIKAERRFKLTWSFAAALNEFRLRLIYHHGFEDAGVTAGHLRRSS